MNRAFAMVSLAAGLSFGAVAYAAAFQPTHAEVKASGLTGETHVLRTGLGKMGLKSFVLRFEKDDHEINSLGFLPAQDRFFTALSDENGDDGYSILAEYLSSPSVISVRKAKGECDGSRQVCKLKIDIGPDETGSVFVLQGFKFKRKGTNDANVKRIMVRGNLAAKQVEVMFIDNGKTPYTAEVQFLTSDRTKYSEVTTVNGVRTNPNGDPALRIKAASQNGTRTVISGFDIEFTNGDHHYGMLSILPAAGYIDVRFADKNADDPFKAMIDYAVYKTE